MIPVRIKDALKVLDMNRESVTDPVFWEKTLKVTFKPVEGRLRVFGESGDPLCFISPMAVISRSEETRRTVDIADPRSDDTKGFFRFVRYLEETMKRVLVDDMAISEKYVSSSFQSVLRFGVDSPGDICMDIVVPETVTGVVYSERVTKPMQLSNPPGDIVMRFLTVIEGPVIPARRKTPNPYVRFAPRLWSNTVFFETQDDLDSAEIGVGTFSVPEDIVKATMTPRKGTTTVTFSTREGVETTFRMDEDPFLETGYVTD